MNKRPEHLAIDMLDENEGPRLARSCAFSVAARYLLSRSSNVLVDLVDTLVVWPLRSVGLLSFKDSVSCEGKIQRISNVRVYRR